jgi:Protein of unknown function (DUF2892)
LASAIFLLPPRIHRPLRGLSSREAGSSAGRNREVSAMLYAKNLPRWEQALRVVLGLALLLAAFKWITGSVFGVPFSWLAGATGAIMIGTGFVGFCPMCAMVGRRRRDTP